MIPIQKENRSPASARRFVLGLLATFATLTAFPASAQPDGLTNNGNHNGFTQGNGNHNGFTNGNGNPNGTVPVTTIVKNLVFPPEYMYASPAAINDSGVVAGNYYDSNFLSHGLVYNKGVIQTFDVPSSTFTVLQGISSDGSVGGMVNAYSNSFVFQGGTTWDLNDYSPATYYNQFRNISQHGPALSSSWRSPGGYLHVLFSGGVITPLADPINLPPGNYYTYLYMPVAVNSQGSVVGYLGSGGPPVPGYQIGNTWTQLPPLPPPYEYVTNYAIADTGDIYLGVQQYIDSAYPHDMLYKHTPGSTGWVRINFPGDTTGTISLRLATNGLCTRADGQLFMVGWYYSDTVPFTAFIAGPSDATF
ncbi:MAG: hypothetical protein K1X78_08740 [Verrucomicrobiaceae bacterium]|nr:hypothetical protein [Verrucomicrobiaceae bacterium]